MKSASFQTAADTLAIQLKQLVQFAFVWRLDVPKSEWAIVAIHVDAIQQQDVKMCIEGLH